MDAVVPCIGSFNIKYMKVIKLKDWVRTNALWSKSTIVFCEKVLRKYKAYPIDWKSFFPKLTRKFSSDGADLVNVLIDLGFDYLKENDTHFEADWEDLK